MCMREEVESTMAAIDERDEKCKIDMDRIETRVASNDALKLQLQNLNSSTSTTS